VNRERHAEVFGATSGEQVARYLPFDYSVTGRYVEGARVIGEYVDPHGDLVVKITGTDVAGGSLDGYVAPRLLSCLMRCVEVTE
jgi:hypothetical protein